MTTEIQQELLEILNEYAERGLPLIGDKTCKLTNTKIFSKMKTKPSHENYISRALKVWENKGKIKITHKHFAGEGLKRIITIL